MSIRILYECLYESPHKSYTNECLYECLNVYSHDVVVKMDITSSDNEYDSDMDIDWIDDSDVEFIQRKQF